MGKSSRSKGRRGESEALLLLQDRDFIVVDTTSGKACEDIFAVKDGVEWAIEVKNRKIHNFMEFRKQAKEQAERRGARVRWCVMSRIPGHAGTFYVERQGEKPTVWGSE